jgi:hypothetical protein
VKAQRGKWPEQPVLHSWMWAGLLGCRGRYQSPVVKAGRQCLSSEGPWLMQAVHGLLVLLRCPTQPYGANQPSTQNWQHSELAERTCWSAAQSVARHP